MLLAPTSACTIICALLLTTCAKEGERVFDNPADSKSPNYVGHEVRSPDDPINVPTVEITDAPMTIEINVEYTYVATASDPNPLMLPADQPGSIVRYDWDFGDGTTIADGSASETHAYTADGAHRVSVTVTDDDGNEKTAVAYAFEKLYDVSTAEYEGALTGHTDWVRDVAISPDGQHIVSGSDDNTVKIWKMAGGALVRTLTGHTHAVYSVAASPDGQFIISAGRDKSVKVWRLADGGLVRTLTGHTSYVHSVAVSQDGQYIVSGSGDNTVKIRRMADGALIRTLTGHNNSVLSVAVSPDGQYIISGSEDDTVTIWRLADGEPIRTLAGHTIYVVSVAVSPDGQYIVSGSWEDNTVRLWKAQQ